MKLGMKSLVVALALGMAMPMVSMAEEDEVVFGRQLMTQEELQAHRQTMRQLKTEEEREAYRAEHHERMLERASERGVTIPDEPLQRGQGRGNGAGAGGGMGPGGGMGGGRGR